MQALRPAETVSPVAILADAGGGKIDACAANPP